MILEEIIDMKELQELQDCFSKATGLAAITVDYKGQPLLRYSGFSNFCRRLRELPYYNDKCCGCDAQGSLEATRRGKVHIYFCHAGLIDFSIPIVIKGAYVGAIMCGQVSSKDSPKISDDLINKNENILESHPELSKHYSEIEVVPFERIVEAANLLNKSLKLMINESLLKKEKDALKNSLEEKIKQDQELNQTFINTYKTKNNHKFFFSALNILSKQAYLENAEKTEDITYALCHIYKYYLKDFKKFTTIRKEIITVETYMYVQNVRFGEFLSFNIDLTEDILDTKFPPLVLQIFVENAFTHGLEPKEYLGSIQVTLLKKLGRIYATVEDNGISISEENCKKFNDKNYFNTLPKEEEGVGIHNAYNRLSYFFKDDFNLHFESKKDGGTKVTFDIPSL